MRTLFLIFIMLFLGNLPENIAQTPQSSNSTIVKNPYAASAKKGRFFFYWGYNRASYATSNIHFKGPHYDFTLFGVKAKDRPTAFNIETYFAPASIWIPQYNYRIGYYFSPRWAISLGLDHMKYVVNNDQSVKMTGTVDTFASKKYAGNYTNTPVTLTEDFLRFEHTDGLNLLSLDAEYRLPLIHFWGSRLRLYAELGGGMGAVIPRTDSHVFGDGLNNNFHLSGWGLSAKGGLRLDIFKRFFFQTQARGGYINLSDILLHNGQPQRANQSIIFKQINGVLGVYF